MREKGQHRQKFWRILWHIGGKKKCLFLLYVGRCKGKTDIYLFFSLFFFQWTFPQPKHQVRHFNQKNMKTKTASTSNVHGLKMKNVNFSLQYWCTLFSREAIIVANLRTFRHTIWSFENCAGVQKSQIIGMVPHEKQNLIDGAKLLYMNFVAPKTLSTAS